METPHSRGRQSYRACSRNGDTSYEGSPFLPYPTLFCRPVLPSQERSARWAWCVFTHGPSPLWAFAHEGWAALAVTVWCLRSGLWHCVFGPSAICFTRSGRAWVRFGHLLPLGLLCPCWAVWIFFRLLIFSDSTRVRVPGWSSALIKMFFCHVWAIKGLLYHVDKYFHFMSM